jgi:hypothetical protein
VLSGREEQGDPPRSDILKRRFPSFVRANLNASETKRAPRTAVERALFLFTISALNN